MNRLLLLMLLMALAQASASAVSLAAWIAGGQPIQVGNKQFGNFSVSSLSGVTAAAIDVAAFTDAGGNGGLRFTTAALAINASGSNELIADVLFDVTITNSSVVIRTVNQAFAANLTAGIITAYDFTSAGTSPAVVTPVASNCVNGGVAGCTQNLTPNDSHIFTGSISFLRVERQIQLLRAKGSTATGTVSSWDVTFSEAPSTVTPSPVVTAVTRGASYLPGAVSPGLIVTVWGDRMGSAQVTTTTPTAEGKLPTSLAGTRVLFDGVPAAVLFTSQKQVSVVVPYSADGKAATQLELEYNGQRSIPYPLAVTDAAPGIFSADATGSGPGAILNVHDDGSVALNTTQQPAPRGSYITVYVTGEGQTNPGGADGLIAVTVLPRPLLKVSATIGGVPATVQYAGGAAYMVAGAMQVNLLVPPDAPAGPAVPLMIQVGDKQSQAGITVSVGN